MKPLKPDSPPDEPEWIFPYTGMSIGDSFFIPTMRPAYMVYMIDVTSKKAGVKVKAYPTTKNGVLGVRAWRVA